MAARLGGIEPIVLELDVVFKTVKLDVELDAVSPPITIVSLLGKKCIVTSPVGPKNSVKRSVMLVQTPCAVKLASMNVTFSLSKSEDQWLFVGAVVSFSNALYAFSIASYQMTHKCNSVSFQSEILGLAIAFSSQFYQGMVVRFYQTASKLPARMIGPAALPAPPVGGGRVVPFPDVVLPTMSPVVSQ